MHGGKCKRHRPLNTPIKKKLEKKKKKKKEKKNWFDRERQISYDIIYI